MNVRENSGISDAEVAREANGNDFANTRGPGATLSVFERNESLDVSSIVVVEMNFDNASDGMKRARLFILSVLLSLGILSSPASLFK